MAQKTELLFVDPFVPDLKTLLENLRPEVQAVVLDARTSAAQQMAQALEGVEELEAIHIAAHGAPGRIVFARGEWSAGTLRRDAHQLASIGRALGDDGQLRLWSCETASSDAGQVFTKALEEVTGAEVCASISRVG